MRLLPILLLIISCITVEAADEYELQYPLGLKRMPIPETNELTAAKIELGKQLYFDPRLSRDDTVSCASCHDPKKGWSNGDHFATGVRGQRGGRSAPTIINSGYSYFQFWDGRAIMLEGQALGPIQNPIEMDLTLEECVAAGRGGVVVEVGEKAAGEQLGTVVVDELRCAELGDAAAGE